MPALGTGSATWDLVLRKLAHADRVRDPRRSCSVRASRRPAVALALGGAVRRQRRGAPDFVRGPRTRRPLDVAIDTVGALVGMLARRLVPGGALRRIGAMERHDVRDRQLDALLERLDRIAEQLERIDATSRGERGPRPAAPRAACAERVADRLAYAALGQSPQVRRRAG